MTNQDNNLLVSHWSNALFQIAFEDKKIKEYGEESRILIALFEKYPEFIQLISSYNIEIEEKTAIIKATFDNFSHYVLNFLLLLAEKNNFFLIKVILKEFRKQCNSYFGVQYGVVYSVIKLSEAQIATVAKKVSHVMGIVNIELINKIDASLIGGIKVKVKNEVFDSSIKGTIEQIRINLSKNNQE